MQKFSSGREAKVAFPSLYQKATLSQVERYNTLLVKFKKHFGESAYLCSSPGRVEIIGNHTDHNGGKGIGATVNLDIVAAFLPHAEKVVMKSDNFRDICFDADDFSVQRGSTGLVKGVMKYLCDRGYKTGGFVACMNSELPSGSGISSSAAFQMLVAEIQNALYNDGQIPRDVLARAGHFAENKYFDKPSGLFDQGVIAYGGLVEIDFRSGFEVTHVADSLEQTLIAVNTGESHSRLLEHFSAIPREMKQIASFFGAKRLIDVSRDDFLANRDKLFKLFGERPVLRAEHFYDENNRVEMLANAVKVGDSRHFNELINLSGDSSRDKLQNYTYFGGENKIGEAVDYFRSICPCGSARVHGGGFAGTVLCVAPDSDAERVVSLLADRYGSENVKQLKVRGEGVKVL